MIIGSHVLLVLGLDYPFEKRLIAVHIFFFVVPYSGQSSEKSRREAFMKTVNPSKTNASQYTSILSSNPKFYATMKRQ